MVSDVIGDLEKAEELIEVSIVMDDLNYESGYDDLARQMREAMVYLVDEVRQLREDVDHLERRRHEDGPNWIPDAAD